MRIKIFGKVIWSDFVKDVSTITKMTTHAGLHCGYKFYLTLDFPVVSPMGGLKASVGETIIKLTFFNMWMRDNPNGHHGQFEKAMANPVTREHYESVTLDRITEAREILLREIGDGGINID